jgi:hypothetical protein
MSRRYPPEFINEEHYKAHQRVEKAEKFSLFDLVFWGVIIAITVAVPPLGAALIVFGVAYARSDSRSYDTYDGQN